MFVFRSSSLAVSGKRSYSLDVVCFENSFCLFVQFAQLWNRFGCVFHDTGDLHGIGFSLGYCIFKLVDNTSIPLALFTFRRKFLGIFQQRNNSLDVSTFKNSFFSSFPTCVILKKIWFRLNQIYFKVAKIWTPEKKPFSNQIVSKELFLCIRTPRKLPLKVNKAKGMPLLSWNLKIQNLINKLIPYKSPVLWKVQPNLFFKTTQVGTLGKKLFSNILMSKNCFSVKKFQEISFLR